MLANVLFCLDQAADDEELPEVLPEGLATVGQGLGPGGRPLLKVRFTFCHVYRRMFLLIIKVNRNLRLWIAKILTIIKTRY